VSTPTGSPQPGPPLVFVVDLDQPVLDDGDRHHLDRALRLRDGDEITVSDGTGNWRLARFGRDVEPIGESHRAARPQPAITVAFALVKGGRPEMITQKLVELGVDRVIPFHAERSVVRWEPGRGARHNERLIKVAREAAMQSRRCHLPDIVQVAEFDDVVGLPGAVGADRLGGSPDLARPTVLVGPEGGWAPAEADRLPATVGLGDHVLRAETAAIAAAALFGALRAGRINPGSSV
jgi:16S rRNA (uracil1498-N3)-methyltransferase